MESSGSNDDRADAAANGLMPASDTAGIRFASGIVVPFTAHERSGIKLNDIE